MEGHIKKMKDSNNTYAFPITVSEAVYVDPSTNLKDKLQEINTIMGSTLGSYVIDLDRWGINHSVTDFNNEQIAYATSLGINSAIEWASEHGYSEVILPHGVYLIHERHPILAKSYMTFNLNGSTLRIRNNSLVGYEIITIKHGQMYARVTNGHLEGDRYDHNYLAVNATHEHGYGIEIRDAKHIMIDHLEINNFTGDGVALTAVPNAQYNLSKHWEQGSIDMNNGILISDPTRIRSVDPINLLTEDIQHYQYFGLYGDGWANLGTQITCYAFDMIFYDQADNFVSSLSNINFFDDIPLPDHATYAKAVLYQRVVPSTTSNESIISVSVGLFPQFSYIENCVIHHCRRLGISGGGKYIYVRNNVIHDISGAAPAGAIDVEDGYPINQFWYVEGNKLSNCKTGVTFVSTRNVVVRNNTFDRLGPGTVWDKCAKVIIDSNHFYRGSWDLRGETIFTNNMLYDFVIMTKHNTDSVIGNCYFHNSELKVEKTEAYKASINNCHFYHDKDSFAITTANKKKSLWYGTYPQTISNCIFSKYNDDDSLVSSAGAIMGNSSALYGWKFINNTFINMKGSLIRLPAGTVRGCTFDNFDGVSLLNNGLEYDFVDCEFRNWHAGQVFFATYNDNHHLKIKDCKFIGDDKRAVYMRDIQGNLELINNTFEYNQATSDFSIVDFLTSTFTCKKLLIDGNVFTSNRPLTAVNLVGHISTNRILFTNNTLETVIQPYSADIILTSGNYINGVHEPFKNVDSLPTVGIYTTGQLLINSSPQSGGYAGWTCTTAGRRSIPWSTKYYNNSSRDRLAESGHIYETIHPGTTIGGKPSFTGQAEEIILGVTPIPPTWQPNTTYSVGTTVLPITFEGYHYKCTVAGTSNTTEPLWSKTSGTTMIEGSVTWEVIRTPAWKEIGNEAVFHPFGLIN